MNTKALRSKILDLAIHGKLLSEKEAAECRKGETATELLEKIRKEKEDKIAKGELKADKKSSFVFVGDDRRHYEKFADGTVKCVEDEIPFEVPDGWAWCRLGEICDYGNCTNVEAINISDDAWILDLEDIEKDTGNIISFQTKHSRNFESTKHIFKKGQLLYSKLRPYLNKVLIAPKDGFCTSEILPLDFGKKIEPSYMRYVLMSAYFLEYANMCSYGVKMPRLGTEDGKKGFIPLPPLSEQKTIIAKIEEIFAQIDILENSKTDLQSTIKHAKSKILDLAIHGKLVPQDPNDEPASKLLDKIHSKCEFDEGKQGKSAEKILHNRHYEKLEDVPFDIPDNWVWCKLPELCCIPITDGTHQTPTYSDKENGIPFLSSKDVTSGKINWTKIKYITKDLHIELSKRIRPKKNDILLAKNGTTGVAALVETDDIFDIYVTLAVIRPNLEIINPKYLHEIINSTFCKKQFNAHLTGIGVPNLHLVDINKTIIPLPPLAEQKRIVEKIESLFSSLDQITENLS